ncbi:MAG: hypothetical protein Q8O94_00270, partial [bacterium]|nr:hypothetical protein [bacterium]
MKNTIRRITTSSTWAASTDMTPVDLPREGLITEVTIRANITCTLTAAAYDDFWRRILQNIKIQGDGGRAFLGMSGVQMSTILCLWNEIVYGMPTLQSNGAGIALAVPDVGSTTFNTIMKFHPGSNPRNPFDLTAAIPARALSTLQALLTTTAAASIVDTASISAGTYNYEICEVLDVPVPAGLMVPMGSTLAYAHTANYSDFSYEIDVPTGAFLRSIVVRVNDETDPIRRKSDEVTGIRLRKPSTGEVVFEQSIRELATSMMLQNGCRGIAGEVGPVGAIADLRPSGGEITAIVPAGFAVIDLRPFGNPLYGIDLR